LHPGGHHRVRNPALRSIGSSLLEKVSDFYPIENVELNISLQTHQCDVFSPGGHSRLYPLHWYGAIVVVKSNFNPFSEEKQHLEGVFGFRVCNQSILFTSIFINHPQDLSRYIYQLNFHRGMIRQAAIAKAILRSHSSIPPCLYGNISGYLGAAIEVCKDTWVVDVSLTSQLLSAAI
jgi:hypothetical protein